MDNNDLLELLKSLFQDEISKNSEYKKLVEKILNDEGNYEDAENLGYEVGDALSKAFNKGITDDVLVDGYLLKDTADEAVRPLLDNGYNIASDASVKVQQAINDAARVGMSPIKAPINADRVNGIIDKATSDLYENVKWVLDEPVKNYMQSVPVEHLEKNFKAQGRSGLRPKLVRKVVGGCCEWCRALAGSYNYPNVPSDIYKRHRNCRCTVDYYPTGRGKSQDVWSKEWRYESSFNDHVPSNTTNRAISTVGVNVTDEYFANARPGEGLLEFDEGYDMSENIREIDAANFLHDTFGGDIRLLKRSEDEDIKTPDYLWNAKLWDLKTTSSEKATNSAVRKGLKQIISNPGGIVLDYRYSDKEIRQSEVLDIIEKRMNRGSNKEADIMMLFPDGEIKVYRYKK